MRAFGVRNIAKRGRNAEKWPVHRVPGEAPLRLPGFGGSNTGLRGKPTSAPTPVYRASGEEYRASGEVLCPARCSGVSPRSISLVVPSPMVYSGRRAWNVNLRFSVVWPSRSTYFGSVAGTSSRARAGKHYIWGCLCWTFHVYSHRRGSRVTRALKLRFRSPYIEWVVRRYRASGEEEGGSYALPWKPGIRGRLLPGLWGRHTGLRRKVSGLWGK